MNVQWLSCISIDETNWLHGTASFPRTLWRSASVNVSKYISVSYKSLLIDKEQAAAQHMSNVCVFVSTIKITAQKFVLHIPLIREMLPTIQFRIVYLLTRWSSPWYGRRRWKDSIKVDLKEIEEGVSTGSRLGPVGEAFVNTVMNLRVA